MSSAVTSWIRRGREHGTCGDKRMTELVTDVISGDVLGSYEENGRGVETRADIARMRRFRSAADSCCGSGEYFHHWTTVFVHGTTAFVHGTTVFVHGTAAFALRRSSVVPPSSFALRP